MKMCAVCEESLVVRKAFAARGWDAWSCDLLPRPGQHITGDCRQLLDKYGCPNCNGDGCERCGPFDLIIAFPPCTHLAVSGAKHFARRASKQKEAIEFFMALANWPAPHVCIENPVGVMSSKWRKPDQIIQPWQFGHECQKTTCLWLRGLPPLKPTKIVDKGEFITTRGGNRLPKWYSDAKVSQKHKTQRARSATFPGIASAMADQWTAYLKGTR